MTTFEDFFKKWNNLSKEKSEIRVDPKHPLDVYIGYNEFNEKRLILIYNPEIQLPDMKDTQIIKIETGQRRSDYRKTWILTLKKSEYDKIFTKLCWDLIDAAEKNGSEEKNVKYIVQRFKKWQDLLENARNQSLSEQIIKGFIGELFFLKEYALPRYGPITAIDGWLGPMGGDKDFQYQDYWIEIKAISIGKNNFTISSLEQLDSQEDGKLCLIYIEKSTQTDKNSTSLPKLMNEIREKLSHETNALDTFNLKASVVGDVEKEEYANKYYAIKKVKEYNVNDSFPKIIREEIPVEITEVTYNLSIAAISFWETNDII
ncbi:hypothetical protein MmiHf6_00200 [Methanimicrococcus hongohii]|uniref:PD-(D/E)XK motif protein n=1 Tax=Methanimicrococcus hongohii TaxID=3028295 RepID=A0AA96UYJ7_9EURY|nr:PD-(D/E)XK motif protein [Methanimicrococcus sp. Hf6]WNY22735.1 hypothetical protein MmiHf6_00200 [Methanimicrococcus sp. Hf6]